MRGQTESGEQEVLNFSGFKPGMAYRLTEFQLYPSTNIGGQQAEMAGSITAGKTAVAPTDPNFNNDGLIATAYLNQDNSSANGPFPVAVINDTFLVTQNLILMVQASTGVPINWQCRFESVKMNGPEEAVTNDKQFAISDE